MLAYSNHHNNNNNNNNIYFIRRLAQGRTSWIERFGALCSSPVEVATQQTFSILMPIMKGPPGGPGCQYKDPNATLLGHSCGCFLVSQWICSICLAREGERGIFHLPQGSGRGWGAAYTGHGRPLAEIRRCLHQCSFCERLTCQSPLNWLKCASAAGGRLYVLCDAAEY